MAEQDDGAERSFEASAQRLQEARKKGNVPQSPELMTLARYTGVTLTTLALAGGLALPFAMHFTGFLISPQAGASFLMGGGDVLTAVGPAALFVVGALALSMVLAVVALVAQQAITFSTEKIKPDLNKLNPIKNAGKKFGGDAMVDFLRSMIKVSLMALVGFWVCFSALPHMLASVGAPPTLLAGEMQALLVKVMLGALGLAAIAAAIDAPLKWSQHAKRLRMTRQEMIEEAKELDGSPEQKKARQEQAHAIAYNRQLQDVPSADVVIVNPEHYAVALKWKRDGSEVPRCVAKGVDHLALRIRMKAEEAGVPVYRHVATARSLYAAVEVGDEIQREHYEAVAAAIRFADKLKKSQIN